MLEVLGLEPQLSDEVGVNRYNQAYMIPSKTT